MKMNKEFFDRYVEVAENFPDIEDCEEFDTLVAEMEYGYEPCWMQVDDDFLCWGMLNEPEITKKIWDMSDKDFAEGLERLKDNIARDPVSVWGRNSEVTMKTTSAA